MPHDVALSQTAGLDLITDLTKIVVVDEFLVVTSIVVVVARLS